MIGELSLPPASTSRTEFPLSALRRVASTQPAEPAPTIMKSNSSMRRSGVAVIDGAELGVFQHTVLAILAAHAGFHLPGVEALQRLTHGPVDKDLAETQLVLRAHDQPVIVAED